MLYNTFFEPHNIQKQNLMYLGDAFNSPLFSKIALSDIC